MKNIIQIFMQSQKQKSKNKLPGIIKRQTVNIIIIAYFLLIQLLSAEENKQFHWDLLRDIRDYKAGRLHYGLLTGTKLKIQGDDAPIIITYKAPENIVVPQYFYFDFPKIIKNKNIKIELNFKWPSSKGTLILAFASWSDNNINKPPQLIGTLLKFGKKGGFFTGNIRYPLMGKTKSKAYTRANLPTMGSQNHTLRINITQNNINSTLDSKHISWDGTTSPNGFAIIGFNMRPKNDGGPCIVLNKFQMNIDLNTKNKE
jgi:hypothetical protein